MVIINLVVLIFLKIVCNAKINNLVKQNDWYSFFFFFIYIYDEFGNNLEKM